MTTVSIRTLSRETARILDEIESHRRGVIVTRNGQEVARIVPLSPLERAFRAQLVAQGVDPDSPPLPPPVPLTRAPRVPLGHKTASDHLHEDRDQS